MREPFRLTTADPGFNPREPIMVNGYTFMPVASVTLARVIKVVAEELGCHHAERRCTDLSGETLLVDDLKCDAIDICCITVAIDEAFDIEITDDEAQSWTCIADIARCVEARRNAA